MEKAKCEVRAQWTGNGEGRTRKFGLRGPEAGELTVWGHTRHMKTKSTWATCIYIGDEEDGIDQVKKEGKCINLDGGRTRINIGESRLTWYAPGFANLILKTRDRWFGGFVLKPSPTGLAGLGLKTGE
jgi:hypothetical protein